VTGASVPTLSAGLLQRYTSKNSWRYDNGWSGQNTAARLVSGTIFGDQYHYTQPTLASGVAQNRFQAHVHILSLPI